MAVPPNCVNFRFHQTAVQTVRSRNVLGEATKKNYHIMPGVIAFDMDKKDAEYFENRSLGEVVKGQPADGTLTYKSRLR